MKKYNSAPVCPKPLKGLPYYFLFPEGISLAKAPLGVWGRQIRIETLPICNL